MRSLFGLSILALTLAGCGTAPADTDEAKAVQKGYGDCLAKLDAKIDRAGPKYVSYNVKDNGYLTFVIGKANSDAITAVPHDERTRAYLADVGC